MYQTFQMGIIIGIVLTAFLFTLPTFYKIVKKRIEEYLDKREEKVRTALRWKIHDKYLGREEAKANYVSHTHFQEYMHEAIDKALEDHEKKWNHSAPYANRVQLTDDKS